MSITNKNNRKYYIARSYTHNELQLVESLIRDFIELGICHLVTYEAPYDLPESQWPAWFRGSGSYSIEINEQTPEQAEWFVRNAPRLMYARMLASPGPHWAELIFDGGNAACFIARQECIPLIARLPSFRALDLAGPWEITPIKRFWERAFGR